MMRGDEPGSDTGFRFDALGIPVYEIKNLNVRHNAPGFPRFCGGGEKYNFSFTAF